MPRKRNYQAEYRRRIERGLARGLSRSQARGHPKANERAIEPIVTKGDPGLEAAIREMNRGTSMTAASRSRHVSAERLRRFLVQEELAERENHLLIMFQLGSIVMAPTTWVEMAITVRAVSRRRRGRIGLIQTPVADQIRLVSVELVMAIIL